MHWAVFLSLAAALSYATYAIITRILARTDSNETTLFYSNLVGALAMSPSCCSYGRRRPIRMIIAPDGGHRGDRQPRALFPDCRPSPGPGVGPHAFIYTELVWMIALGFLVFGDVPNRWTIAAPPLWSRPPLSAAPRAGARPR